MDMQELRDYLDNKFDRIETKLDNYSERLVRVEEKTKSFAGYIKFGASISLATITAIISYAINHIRK